MSHLPKQSEGTARYSVRVPRLDKSESIGLGDVIKRATSAVGFQPCGGCERRATELNKWLSFSGRQTE